MASLCNYSHNTAYLFASKENSGTLIASTQPATIQSSLGRRETIRVKRFITTYHITYGNSWQGQLVHGLGLMQRMKQLFLSQEA
jgi:hypothetical protein